ncbi:MAG: PriCT-2 domain-containing protein [Gammaproteobacteria bacterium]|nr:PriCT-2 domain-containing protein [Gammaproteobacteria bacterium]
MQQLNFINFPRSKAKAARRLNIMGAKVIPIIPEEKRPTGPWSDWMGETPSEVISTHWEMNPNHDVGIITLGLYVMDADSEQAVTALHRIEAECGMESLFIVKTRKGEHHYYQLPEDVEAKSQSFSTASLPENIDVRANKAIIIAPGSTNKTVIRCDINSFDELTPVTQEFVDAIKQHNSPMSASGETPSRRETLPTNSEHLLFIQKLVANISPEHYERWIGVGMAIHNETAGSDQGLQLYDCWSSSGSTYKGRAEIEHKWNSFKSDTSNSMTLGSLIHWAREAGADIDSIRDSCVEQFTIVPRLVINTDANEIAVEEESDVPLRKFSLLGQSSDLARLSAGSKLIFNGLAQIGQATVWYASPNSGKTLCTISFVNDDHNSGNLRGYEIYYLNMDDSAKGLAEKAELLEDIGVHMIAHGHRGFDIADFPTLLDQLAQHRAARKIILILDTLTKFVDTMKASACREISQQIRAFVSKGGTVLALAHTNKQRGDDGNPVPEGTMNILNNFDCSYTIDTPPSPNANKRLALFKNIKRRGNVVLEFAVEYANQSDISYSQLVASVTEVPPDNLDRIRHEAELESDDTGIQAILSAIESGATTKIALAKQAAAAAGVGKNTMLLLIEKYTGSDPGVHLWNFEVKKHGAKHFYVLGE